MGRVLFFKGLVSVFIYYTGSILKVLNGQITKSKIVTSILRYIRVAVLSGSKKKLPFLFGPHTPLNVPSLSSVAPMRALSFHFLA